MKIVLGNCVHYQAKALFAGHDVMHARDVGWRRLSNGQLLAEAAKRFDVLVTTDKKIRFEHDLHKLPLSVLELNSHFTRIVDLRTLAPHLPLALLETARFRFVSVKPDGILLRLGEIVSG